MDTRPQNTPARGISRAHAIGLCVALLLSLLAATTPANTDETVRPLFDTHIHYNQDFRERIPPDDVISRLDRAGIGRAFVSSTPTEGTVALYRLAPDRIVPLLRPYRSYADRRTWHSDPTLIDRLKEKLAVIPYRGIGEFHVFGEDASSDEMLALTRLATERGLFLHAHSDEDAIVRILQQAPGLSVIWAHAGFDVPLETLDALLRQYPRLSIELSYRSDIAPGGQLSPEWRSLFVTHSQRFLFGSDTHVGSRWLELEALAGAGRGWLDQLPVEVAEQIAFRNAERLAGNSD
jgi:hypothetical protein